MGCLCVGVFQDLASGSLAFQKLASRMPCGSCNAMTLQLRQHLPICASPLKQPKEGPDWLFRVFRVAPEPVDSYLRGEVEAAIAGPIVHEIYALGQPDGESSPWFYGQYLEAHPLPVNAKLLIHS